MCGKGSNRLEKIGYTSPVIKETADEEAIGSSVSVEVLASVVASPLEVSSAC